AFPPLRKNPWLCGSQHSHRMAGRKGGVDEDPGDLRRGRLEHLRRPASAPRSARRGAGVGRRRRNPAVAAHRPRRRRSGPGRSAPRAGAGLDRAGCRGPRRSGDAPARGHLQRPGRHAHARTRAPRPAGTAAGRGRAAGPDRTGHGHDTEDDMTELRGVGIGLGVAQGPVARMADPLPAPSDAPSTASADDETARAREAVAAVARELEARGAQAGGAAQEVLEAQAMMAEDPALQAEIDARIAAGKTAEWAVHDAFASFRETLAAMGGYLGERAADLDDVA